MIVSTASRNESGLHGPLAAAPALLLGGMMRSLPSWIHTRLLSFSGLSHFGVTFAASTRRNSPSLSETRIHRLGCDLLSSRRR